MAPLEVGIILNKPSSEYELRAKARSLLFIAVVAALSIAIYLVASLMTYRVGFPLDDAWIHQTYARNLAHRGEWSFLPGRPSAGSTSPLWSALLALGYLLRLSPLGWTWFLGFVILSGIGFTGMRIYQAIIGEQSQWPIYAAIFLMIEWHIVWAAVSGMETALFILFVLWVANRLLEGDQGWLSTGFLVGLSIWVRPDGLSLLGPALFTLVLIKGSRRKKILSLLSFLLGFGLIFAPYLLWNRLLDGSWWPNTYYAKQAEYAVELQDPLWRRIMEQAMQPMIGAGVLLAPGFVLSMLALLRKQRWAALSIGIWFMGFLVLYALRLPVTYQHGRYVMPAMAIYFLFGLAGMANWYSQGLRTWRKRVVGRTWVSSTALVAICFWFIGARAYGRDVAFIESEMVVVARWVASYTEDQAVIAAHDIGALGYYGGRTLIDLAGLISPEVVPFIRDEAKLKEYLDQRRADYLVTFPGWYPNLIKGLTPLFTTGGDFSQAFDGENMVVYLWARDRGQ